ncbi:MAG: High-affinity Na(+)/H(+) antiporter NhaS3 [Myxococcota bacterium]|nr:High-affinity Na(+)/H(+) antiporter NhaS3 [Myxococcota bacterium]
MRSSKRLGWALPVALAVCLGLAQLGASVGWADSSGGGAPATGTVAAVGADHGGGHGDDGGGGGHADPVASVILGVLIILIVAKVGGDIAERLKQPSVLGELIGGMVAGNAFFWVGNEFFTVLREGSTIEAIKHEIFAGKAHDWFTAAKNILPESAFAGEGVSHGLHLAQILSSAHGADIANSVAAIDILARIGVIVLLFMVGLESSVRDMMKVGVTAFAVAIAGVVAPMILGYIATAMLMPESSVNTRLFIGGTLCATSVGITARVFKDLGKLQVQAAKIILGAAVIDDVLGLIVLAIIMGIIQSGGHIDPVEVTWISAKSLGFVAASIAIGMYVSPFLIKAVSRLRVHGVKQAFALVFCFVLAWAANAIGLAAIVGAFAAGLVLEELMFKDFHGHEATLLESFEPIAAFLVPIFFVLMGIQVKLEAFADPKVLMVGLIITLAAIAGKQVCGAVVKKGMDRLTIGIGMVPRGEVGLIMAAIGKNIGVLNDAMFSAMVIMVIGTTLITPPLLKFSLARWDKKQPA